MTGRRVGHWTVLCRAEVEKRGYWLCRCDCGIHRVVAGATLRNGKSTACGHLKPARIDLSGRRFGRLVALTYVNGASWICRCDCGSTVEVVGKSLREGDTKSCGCIIRDRGKAFNEMIRHPEYGTWIRMKHRCHSSSDVAYADYGGRGIKVCDSWRESFYAFLADVGPRPSSLHTLGRINNDGNYQPGNVRWETFAEQSRNKRSTVWVEWSGRRWVMTDLARHIGVDPRRLRARHIRFGNINEAVARSTGEY